MSRPSAALTLIAVAALGQAALAQTADEVRTDVLSALATPLPITIIGPLMTRDVVVTEDGDGFLATLQDTSVMGLFPLGEVSMRMEPLDGDTYRVTDLTFPAEIDIPGMARLSFTDMAFDGTWNAATRSYSDLTWATDGLTLAPPEDVPGSISIGRLAFDVVKEPDEEDTESRFAITLSDLAVLGMGPQDVQAGEVAILLAANGEQPVDLYSVIRETLLRSTMGGGDLGALGQSLLGNTYSTVTLDLAGRDLDIRDVTAPDEVYLTAAGMSARVDMAEVAPTDWGAAAITLTLEGVQQRDYMPEDSVLSLAEASVTLRGTELPVADMMTAAMLLADPPFGQAVPASVLVDGLMEFGSLEMATSGSGLSLLGYDREYTDTGYDLVPLFDLGYDSWSLVTGVSGLNVDAGTLTFAGSGSGGTFASLEAMEADMRPHIEAWFPVSFAVRSTATSLNEGLLKRLLQDVMIAKLDEPVELFLPLAIYGASTVIDMTLGEDHYETALFRVTQSGNLRFYPSEIFSLMPYEGAVDVTMTGMDALSAYVASTAPEMGREPASALQSVLTVLSNLAEEEAGTLTWAISRPDVYRREITVNDVTLRYPDVMQFMPLMMYGVMGRF